jgi:hypothetical protein
MLNNKGNLPRIAPSGSIPDRETVPLDRLLQPGCRLPCVVKVATDEPTAGGHAVAICRCEDDLRAAYDRFRSAEWVVIEELLQVDRALCLTFAAFADGTVRYHGAAEQVCLPTGAFAGNWLEASEPPPEAVEAARQTAERGASHGFVGLLGIDVLIAGGRSYVVDLNFRFNASTTGVLLCGAVRRAFGDVVIRSKRLSLPAGDWERRLTAAIDDQRVVPFSIYDTDASPYAGRPPAILALIVGTSRSDVEDYVDRLEGP